MGARAASRAQRMIHVKVKTTAAARSEPSAQPATRGSENPDVASQTPAWHHTACPNPAPVPGFALARQDCGSSPEHRLFLSFKFRVQKERGGEKKKKKALRN